MLRPDIEIQIKEIQKNITELHLIFRSLPEIRGDVFFISLERNMKTIMQTQIRILEKIYDSDS